MMVIAAATLIGGGLLLFSQIPNHSGVDGIPNNALSSELEKVDLKALQNIDTISTSVNKHTLEQLNLIQLENGANFTNILLRVIETEKKVSGIENCLKALFAESSNSSALLPKTDVVSGAVDTVSSFIPAVVNSPTFGEMAVHVNTEIAASGSALVFVAEKYARFFGSIPPPGI